MARIFKVHVQVGRYDPRDDLLDAVWGRLEETGTPVVIPVSYTHLTLPTN